MTIQRCIKATIFISPKKCEDLAPLRRGFSFGIGLPFNIFVAHAAKRADALLDTGDLEGAATWRKMIAAIEVMQATEPDGATH